MQQLRVAPYSYDWVDFAGSKSPRRLTPDLPTLSVGQSFLIFRVTEFEEPVHITGALPPERAARHGDVAVSYQVVPSADGRCRLVVRVAVEKRSGASETLRRRGLAWGDLIMMRKQLLTLKKLAERDARADR
ncbi:hypothetical protein [Streptomyces sp. NPDC047028]|uniref:hypothetical protein n=1 Tax=Streptomyces sp. NPDC047028 TaxID=3155793 RepID=UPI00340110CC